MKAGDDKHMDAELEALLQAIPQPRPPAALDAAILADAEAALTENPVGGKIAANDAVAPESANAKHPNFMTRWKVPLAFAATVMLAVHIVGLQWFAAPVYDAPAMSPEAAAPVPAAAPAANATPPAAPAADAAAETASELRRAAPAAKPAQQARAREAQPKIAEARKEMRERSGASAGAGGVEKESGDSLNELAARKSDAVRSKPEAVPAPAAVAAAPAAVAAPQAEGFRQYAPSQSTHPAPANRAAAGAVTAGAKGLAAAGLHDKAEAAPQAFGAEPVPGSMAGAASGQSAEAGASQATTAPLAKRAYAAKAAPKDPKEWLAHIDKLITDGKRKEAREEWAQFRKAYPDYQVAPELQKRTDALKE